MELEASPPTTDEQARLLASAKKITLQPVSKTVLPEAALGADLNTKLSETAHQSNALNDSEDTAVQLERTQKKLSSQNTAQNDTDHPAKKALFFSTAASCFFVAAFIWLATQ